MARDPHSQPASDTLPNGEVSARHPVEAFVSSLRPDQWIKNLIVFAGLMFGQRLLNGAALGAAFTAFAIFCGLSSSMYLVNDLVDREDDRRHPSKRLRPIASGTLSSSQAITGAVLLGGVSLPAAFWLDQLILIVAAATLVSYAFYTVAPSTVEKFGTDQLTWTLPFPIYGIFRYLYLVHRHDGGGSPAEMLLRDRPLLACVALWAAAILLIIYRPWAG